MRSAAELLPRFGRGPQVVALVLVLGLVGAMAIEHNEEEPKRTQIIEYLRQHGYERVHTYRQDDFFAPISR